MFRNLILIVTFVTLCRAQSETAIDIRRVLDSQSAAWNSGDIDGYMNGYWQSDSLLFTSGGNITRGFDSTKAKYKRKYNSKEAMGTLAFSAMEINELEENSAWVLGKWRLERATDSPHGIFTLVLKKISGVWKIIHDHTSLQSEK